MPEYTIDQIQNFLSVVNHGSFSAAARATNRALPAVTYAVRKLEEQVGAELFDRSDYRPTLTQAGHALLPSARRMVEEYAFFRAQAHRVAAGAETSIAIAVDRYFPMEPLADALVEVQHQHPSVEVMVHGEALDGVARLVLDQQCDLGILPMCVDRVPQLKWAPLMALDFVIVTRADHPLAQMKGVIGNDVLARYEQLMVVDRFDIIRMGDYFVYSRNVWKFDSLSSMMSVLKKGIGYAIIPDHLVAQELQDGTLVSLIPEDWNRQRTFQFQFCVCWHDHRPLGPIASWLIDHLQASLPDNAAIVPALDAP